jgi:hypothetical protein
MHPHQRTIINVLNLLRQSDPNVVLRILGICPGSPPNPQMEIPQIGPPRVLLRPPYKLLHLSEIQEAGLLVDFHDEGVEEHGVQGMVWRAVLLVRL